MAVKGGRNSGKTSGQISKAGGHAGQAGIARQERQKGKVGGTAVKVDKADGLSRCTNWEERQAGRQKS
jgi:hypothetical protein